MIGVVIPTFNEAERLPALLEDLRQLSAVQAIDVVVADGGSSDQTRARAAALGVTVLPTSRGRALQLNSGAAAVQGDWLLFIHADCRLTPQCRIALVDAITREPSMQAAVFRFAIDLPAGWKQFIEWGQALRQRVLGLPYGDQGLLVRRSRFEAVGGFPELPLMEDIALVRRLRREGNLRTLPAPLLTSGRRYQANGIIRTWLMHTALILLYAAGVPPRRLASLRERAAR